MTAGGRACSSSTSTTGPASRRRRSCSRELCGELADEFDVTVVTGQPSAAARPSGRATTASTIVRVARPRSTARASGCARVELRDVPRRLAASPGCGAPRPDVVLCMTDPPVIADVALLVARRFRAPLVVISQDVFPEIAVELKRLDNPFVIGALRARDPLLPRARRPRRRDRRDDAARLEEKGAPPERLRVIPNWVDTDALDAAPARQRVERASTSLDDRFVVMHSGNIGHAQNLDSLIRAATFLRDLDDLAIVLIGDGARRAELMALAGRLEVDDGALPAVPGTRACCRSRSRRRTSTSSGSRAGLSGYVVPSRLYGILAAGRPVIAAADAESETAQRRPAAPAAASSCRRAARSSSPSAIRSARRRRARPRRPRRRGREYVVATPIAPRPSGAYRALLREAAAAS